MAKPYKQQLDANQLSAVIAGAGIDPSLVRSSEELTEGKAPLCGGASGTFECGHRATSVTCRYNESACHLSRWGGQAC